MSDCCSGTSCSATDSETCPECSEKGQNVEQVTLRHLLHKARVAKIKESGYSFCKTPSCSVVYFSNEPNQSFFKTDMRVRVGIKETGEPIPVCYCFDYTREKIFEEIKATGESAALAFITEKVKAGQCHCEKENPSGRCCLGEVNKTIKAAQDQVGVMNENFAKL